MKKAHGNFKLFGKYAWYVPGVADLFILLLFLLVGALLGNGVSLLFVGLMGQAGMEYATLISYPLMFIPPMLYAAAKSRKNALVAGGLALNSSHFAPLGGVLCALLVALATLSGALMSDAVNALLPPMPEWLETILKNMTTGRFWVNFLCVSIFAPFFEEWLCRGMVLRGLLGRGMKPVWAIVVSALFFALIHMNPWQAIPAFLLGCLFGYVYFKTGSLLLTMLMHFVNNTAALVVGHIDSLKDYDNWIDLLGAKPYAFAFAGCALLIVLIVLQLRRIPLQKPSGACDEVPALFTE
ncbi:MAG: CPBP family intramembrane metalloprotease [Bacteroidales bacterium]|nr:CPBP family intramembrane metalloprotease [Bacteroidales bacterium]